MKKEKEKKVETKEVVDKESTGLWGKFMNFCHGVKSEAKKVRWTSKKDMVKYSIAVIVFVVFCSLFFYSIDAAFAFVQSLFK